MADVLCVGKGPNAILMNAWFDPPYGQEYVLAGCRGGIYPATKPNSMGAAFRLGYDSSKDQGQKIYTPEFVSCAPESIGSRFG